MGGPEVAATVPRSFIPHFLVCAEMLNRRSYQCAAPVDVDVIGESTNAAVQI